MMFKNQRYLTRGIQEHISWELQSFMWNMIDDIKIQKDYFQVFKLESRNVEGKLYQHILHFQEEPEYSKEVVFQSENPVTCKIYVIDDGDHSTMLLAEEY